MKCFNVACRWDMTVLAERRELFFKEKLATEESLMSQNSCLRNLQGKMFHSECRGGLGNAGGPENWQVDLE